MKKILTAMVLAACVAGSARAQQKGGEAKAGGPPAAMQMPKPPDWTSSKWLLGTWTCTGPLTFAGMNMKVKLKVTNKPDLDNFWMTQTADSKASKDQPMAIKWNARWTMDATGKGYYQVADNSGAYETGTGRQSGDGFELTGKVNHGGQTADVSHAWKKVSDTEWHWTGTESPGGVSWDWTCKK